MRMNRYVLTNTPHTADQARAAAAQAIISGVARDPISEFADAMSGAGVPCAEPPVPDGKLHRYHIEGDRAGSRNGWYVLHLDGIPAGAFGSWRTGQESTWSARRPESLSAAERAELERHLEAARAEREQAEAELRAEAREQARATWESAAPVEGADHPYLAAKGVRAHGLRRTGPLLLVPVQDLADELHSLQRIAPDGAKRFLPGGAVSGHLFLLGAPAEGVPLLVAEGYATGATLHETTGHPVAVAFNAGNLRPVAEALRTHYPGARLLVCADDDHATEGNPGLTKAQEASEATGARLAVPVFKDPATRGTDFNDLAAAEGADTVRVIIAAALASEAPAESPAAAVVRLAALHPLEYDRVREAEAKALGVRVATLDAEVKKARGAGDSDPEALVETVEPWPEPVAGAQLLEEVARLFARHVVLPEGAATALALWVVGTYTYDLFRVWPRLALLSPVKRCGKTTLIEALAATCCRPLVASNITPAALFRTIQDWRPTLLIDEGDTFARDNDELRGIVNSGHTRAGAFVIRTVGEDHEPRRFSTWAPLAIAAIGTLPGTIMDRSVIVRLRRKGPGERADKLALEVARDCLELRQRAARWAEDHSEALRAARPKLPPSGNDRALDNWAPLLAIAERAGEDWPTRARDAFHALASDEEDDGAGPLLLADIRDLFTVRRTDRLPSADLAEHLGKLEERPWPEWKHGKPITARQVAALLRPFKIVPTSVRTTDGRTPKGYHLEQFADAWHRYLPETPPIDPQHRHNVSGPRVSADFDPQHPAPPVADRNPLRAKQDVACGGVADREGGSSTITPFEGGLDL